MTSLNPSNDADNASPDRQGICPDQIKNDTSTSDKSRVGYTMEVTLWISTHHLCPSTLSTARNRPSNCEHADLEVQPHVVGSYGRFILLCTHFASGEGVNE